VSDALSDAARSRISISPRTKPAAVKEGNVSQGFASRSIVKRRVGARSSGRAEAVSRQAASGERDFNSASRRSFSRSASAFSRARWRSARRSTGVGEPSLAAPAAEPSFRTDALVVAPSPPSRPDGAEAAGDAAAPRSAPSANVTLVPRRSELPPPGALSGVALRPAGDAAGNGAAAPPARARRAASGEGMGEAITER
jgi:hypothetical protein